MTSLISKGTAGRKTMTNKRHNEAKHNTDKGPSEDYVVFPVVM